MPPAARNHQPNQPHRPPNHKPAAFFMPSPDYQMPLLAAQPRRSVFETPQEHYCAEDGE